jgi:aminoglycoside 3-N-acetyltransferase
MINKVINYYKGKEISNIDILRTLKSLGIKQGDTICVHTDISSFGIPAIKDKNSYLQCICDVLNEAVGENGNIVMPTFSYSFTNKHIYDINNTRSQMGVLTEYFRKLPQTIRTEDPIFSFAISGGKNNYFANNDNNCFSKNSVYGKLHKENAKLILLGSRVKGYTFFHYIEQCYGVPYRFYKNFKGQIKDVDDNIYETEYVYYVRHLDRPSSPNINMIIKYLKKYNNFKERTFAYGSIVCIDFSQFYNSVIEKLKQDVTYFCE